MPILPQLGVLVKKIEKIQHFFPSKNRMSDLCPPNVSFLVFWFIAAFQFQTIQIQRKSKRKSDSKLFAWGLPAAKPRKWLPPNGVTVAPVKLRICEKHGLRGPGPQEAFPKKPAGRPRPATEAVAASRRRWPRPLESLVLGKSPF